MSHEEPKTTTDLTSAAQETRVVTSKRPLEAANTTPSRADAVYARLLQAINDGRFRAGDRVLEAEIADWLMVSRTPVREALRRLESEDVLARGTQGLTVVAMAEDEILELYDLREVLEGTAAEFAARNARISDIRELQRVLEREARSPSDDALQLAAINRNFHVALAAAAHNRYLSKTLNAMQDAFLRLRSTTFSIAGRPGKALTEHSRIVEAIERRDAAVAGRYARAHIRESRRARLRLNKRVQEVNDSHYGPGKPPRVWR